jgi:hypothetical protein
MCDYSLQGLPNRLAAEGEELAAHRFLTGTIGFTSPHEARAIAEARAAPKRSGFWAAIKDFQRRDGAVRDRCLYSAWRSTVDARHTEATAT